MKIKPSFLLWHRTKIAVCVFVRDGLFWEQWRWERTRVWCCAFWGWSSRLKLARQIDLVCTVLWRKCCSKRVWLFSVYLSVPCDCCCCSCAELHFCVVVANWQLFCHRQLLLLLLCWSSTAAAAPLSFCLHFRHATAHYNSLNRSTAAAFLSDP